MARCGRLDIDGNGPILRSIMKKPPKHHTMKIVQFSTLKSMDKYESTKFKAGGYKWKLVLFPNGNKKRNVDDHISLYLEMCGDKGIDPKFFVTVDYKFFLLNGHEKNYLVFEDANKNMKKYCIFQTIIGGLAGFDQFIPLEDFSDVSNGYLINDTCEFGVDLFVSKRKRRGATEEFVCGHITNTVMYKYVWMIRNFSKLNVERLCSKPFTAGDQKYCMWRLHLYPKGRGRAKGIGFHSFVLELYKPHTYFPDGAKVFVRYTIRVVDQIHGEHHYRTDLAMFTTSESLLILWTFITPTANARLLKYDSCIYEVEITILGLLIPQFSTP